MAATPTPRRMSLANVETGESVAVQFNPTSVSIDLAAFYNKLKIPGQSFEALQYSNSGNTTAAFKLAFDGRAQGFTTDDLIERQNFLLSLCAPPQTVTAVSTGAPPRVLFAWPGWISMITRAPKLKIQARRFNLDGVPDYLEIDVELEESRTSRFGSELVRRSGLRRAA